VPAADLQSPNIPTSGAPFAPSPANLVTARRLRVCMGTLVAIEATCHSQRSALDSIEAAFAAVMDIDRRMHPRRPHSDLDSIRTAPLHHPIAIHQSTWDLLKLAKRLNVLTGGVFDPCLPGCPGGLRDVELRDEGPCGGAGQRYVTCHAAVELDFGGFAKGYAVDRATQVLVSRGCICGLVNAGGDLRLFGPRQESILLRRADGHFTAIELAGVALAVSDVESRQRPGEHQGYYSGAGRGRSISGPLTPTDDAGALVERYGAVIANEAVVADALVKCVLLCTGRVAQRALREFHASRVCAD